MLELLPGRDDMSRFYAVKRDIKLANQATTPGVQHRNHHSGLSLPPADCPEKRRRGSDFQPLMPAAKKARTASCSLRFAFGEERGERRKW
jgi:hypothetical protein